MSLGFRADSLRVRAYFVKLKAYSLLLVLIRALDRYTPSVNWFMFLGTPARVRKLNPGEKQTVFAPAMEPTRPPLVLRRPAHRNFAPTSYFPEVFLAQIRDGVSTNDGYNISAAGELLPETSVEAYLGTLPPRSNPELDVDSYRMRIDLGFYRVWNRRVRPPRDRVDGRVTTLTSRWQGTYFHWLFDVIPRLHLLERLGITPGTLYVDATHSFQIETLRLLGYEEEQLIRASDHECVWAAELLVPSLPGVQGLMPKWVCDYLRRKFLPASLDDDRARTRRGRRLYITRQNARYRRIANDDEVSELLMDHGFESVALEHLKFEEQVKLLQDASVVVAPHGAGLANTVFCRRGTTVIEIFSPDYVNTCYWDLSLSRDLQYYCLLGKGVDRVPDGELWTPDGCRQDITVPITDLRQLLRRARLTDTTWSSEVSDRMAGIACSQRASSTSGRF